MDVAPFKVGHALSTLRNVRGISMSQAKDPQSLPYEQAFQELQSIVEALEDSDHSLEESLALYERGQALAARCNELLDGAELRLSKLVPDEEGGYREVDFEPPAEDDE